MFITEEFARESFSNFSEDLDSITKRRMKKLDRNAYNNIITQNKYYKNRDTYYPKKDVRKYSFEELYSTMCDLFYWLDEGRKDILYKIFLLKNFINYKIEMEVA